MWGKSSFAASTARNSRAASSGRPKSGVDRRQVESRLGIVRPQFEHLSILRQGLLPKPFPIKANARFSWKSGSARLLLDRQPAEVNGFVESSGIAQRDAVSVQESRHGCGSIWKAIWNSSMASRILLRARPRIEARLAWARPFSARAGDGVPPQGFAVVPERNLPRRADHQRQDHQRRSAPPPAADQGGTIATRRRPPRQRPARARSAANRCNGPPVACAPTWTRPMTGTSIPTYQNQPLKRYGKRRLAQIAAAEMPSSAAPETATSQTGQPSRGRG